MLAGRKGNFYNAHGFSEQEDQVLLRDDARGTEKVPCEGKVEEAQAPDNGEGGDNGHGGVVV